MLYLPSSLSQIPYFYPSHCTNLESPLQSKYTYNVQKYTNNEKYNNINNDYTLVNSKGITNMVYLWNLILGFTTKI